MDPARRYLFDPDASTSDNSLRILCDGPEIFPAIFDAIRNAKQRVAIEMYKFEADSVGREVRHALVEAAHRGCEVRLIYDDVGSLWTPREFFYPLQEAGGRVRVYHPIAPLRRSWAWIRRNHRKMLLVDDDYVLIGGVNVAEAYSRSPLEGGYHDLAVEVRGPTVAQAWKIFEETWERRTSLRSKMQTLPDWVRKSKPAGIVPLEIVGNRRFRDRGRIRRTIVYAISQAETSVTILNPYFLPDQGLIVALGRAVERGVRVRVIVPETTDVVIVDLASLMAQRKLLKRGVEIYTWPGMAHGKAVSVDGVWLSIGSYNFDHLSLFRNLEVVVNAVDPTCGRRLAEILEADVQKSRRFTDSEWSGMHWWKRVLARLFYRIRKLL